MVKLRKFIRENWLALFIITVATAAYLIYEVMSYQKFRFQLLDLGLYNRHMWSLARLDFSANPLKGFNLLGDHAHFILLLLAPFYALYQSPIFLLIVQVLCISLSGYPIYLIAKGYFKNITISALWLVPYYLYFGFASALAFPFHVAPLAVLPLSWALYFLLNKKYKPLIWMFLIMALIKEDMPTLTAGFGVYLILFHRKRLLGAISIIVSAAYLIFLTKYWLPHISHLPYGYAAVKETGNSIWQNASALIRDVFLPSVKSHTMLYEIISFSGLSLLAPEFLILLAPLWLGRFLSAESWRWTTMQHYSATQAPILMVAAVIGTYRLMKWLKPRIKAKYILGAATLVVFAGSLLCYHFIDRKPLSELLKPSLYLHDQTEITAEQAIKLIPDTASVGTVSAFPMVSNRQNIVLISGSFSDSNPDFLLLSTAVTLDYWPLTSQQQVLEFVQTAQSDYHYKKVIDQDGVILLQKDSI